MLNPALNKVRKAHHPSDPLKVLLEASVQVAVAISDGDAAVVRPQQCGVAEGKPLGQLILCRPFVKIGIALICCPVMQLRSRLTCTSRAFLCQGSSWTLPRSHTSVQSELSHLHTPSMVNICCSGACSDQL